MDSASDKETKAAYFSAFWSQVIDIAQKEYEMDKHTANIYAWCLSGRMIESDYEKLEH